MICFEQTCFRPGCEPKLPGKEVVYFEQCGFSPSDMLTLEIWRAAMLAHAKCRALAEEDAERDEKHSQTSDDRG
jgi:hypothetical protein